MQPSDDARFEFVHQFVRDREQGVERPLADYLRRFPDHAAMIAAEYERLAGEIDRAEDPDPDGGTGATIGSYRLLRELGRGGQATVWLAHDTRVDRHVALKLLPLESVLRIESKIERFRREARVLGQLAHPGICTVLEADVDGRRPYIAMRYVEGESLGVALSAWREGAAVPDVATIPRILAVIERAARALHAAHEAGVVHRDVKPSNIVIEGDDQPVLVDFGLARLEASSDATLTRVGDMPGTLAYMAPELLNGRTAADRRADVYSLGVTLFEGLTGRRPFVAESREGLWRAIVEDAPSDPRACNAAVPRDVAIVVLKALSKRPEDRYETALAFAEDLRRARSYEPIVAQRVGAMRRVRLWARRHPIAAGGLAALAAMAVLSMVLALEAHSSERSARQTLAAFDEADPVEALQHMVDAAETMRTTRTDGMLWRGLDLCNKAYTLIRHLPSDTPDDAGAADRYLAGSRVVDPAGERMAFLTHGGMVEVFRIRDGEWLHRFRAHEGGVVFRRDLPIAFSPDGATLLTGGRDGLAKRWRTTDWSEIDRIALAPAGSPREGVASVGFAPNGSFCVVAGESGSLLIRDLASAAVRRLDLGDQLISNVAMSKTSRRILAFLDEERAWAASRLVCVDRHEGAVMWQRSFDRTPILSWGWHPAGVCVAVGTSTAEVLVLDGATGATQCHVPLLAEEPNVRWCSFDQSGDRLLVGAPPGFRVFDWNGATASLRATVAHPHRRATVAAALSPEHDVLASLARDGSLTFVDPHSWQVLRTFDSPGMATDRLSLHWATAAGRIVANRNYTIDVWHAPPLQGVRQMFTHVGAIRSVDVHPDGDLLLSAAEDGRVCCTEIETGRGSTRTLGHPPVAARFSPTGSRYLVCDGERVLILETQGGKLLRTEAATWAMFLDDDYAMIALDKSVARLEVSTGTKQPLHLHEGAVRAAVVDAVNQRLFTGGVDRFVRAAHLGGGSVCPPILVDTPGRFRYGSPFDVVAGLGVAPRAGLLLVSCVNNDLFLYPITDAARERLPQAKRLETDRFGGLVAVHPDESVAVLSDVGFGRITWIDLRTLDFESRVESNQHTQTVTAIRFSKSGRLCLTAALDGTVQIWDTATREIRSTLRLDDTTIHDACFTPDERSFVTGDGRGRIKIWPVEPLPVAIEYLKNLRRVRR